MNDRRWIESPDDPLLDELCARLDAEADELDLRGRWPVDSLQWFADSGVWSWFVPERFGGQGWPEQDIVAAYLKLGEACLTLAFITTQWSAAAKRLMSSENFALAAEVAPGLLDGSIFTTVGISHLTTSRRHLGKPALSARDEGDAYVLNGFSPWVTGGAFADLIVTGASLDDGSQVLLAVPSDLSGVSAGRPHALMALSASGTGPVHFQNVRVSKERLLAGPVENVLTHNTGPGTGGLQTSALALASAMSSIDYIEAEAEARPELRDPVAEFHSEREQLASDLLRTAAGETVCAADQLRVRANGLALRASQSAMAAAKGTGYVTGHRAGRLCRESLFFLVWSCPQPVVMAHLCELAGLGD